MKLRTLKDLKGHILRLVQHEDGWTSYHCLETEKGEMIRYDKNDKEIKVFTKDELRKEAIKWIKQLNNEEFNKPIPLKVDNKKLGDIIMLNGLVDWIKYFFNITEEDLK